MGITTYSAPNPQGKTYAVTIPANTSTTTTPLQLVGTSNSFWITYPAASSFIWLAFAPTAAQATANCVAPTAGNPQNVTLLYYLGVNGTYPIINIPANWYVVFLNGSTIGFTAYIQAVN
jgi:hypothetical protein